MKKIVNFCGNCPFLYNENDLYDESVKHLCVLSKNLDLNFHYVDNIDGDFDKNITPVWCPLKNEEYTFSFKDFSDDILMKNNEFIENTDSDLSKEIDNISILKNDEEYKNDEEDIEKVISKSIDEIKNQMNYIEEASAKLQEVFSRFTEG